MNNVYIYVPGGLHRNRHGAGGAVKLSLTHLHTPTHRHTTQPELMYPELMYQRALSRVASTAMVMAPEEPYKVSKELRCTPLE